MCKTKSNTVRNFQAPMSELYGRQYVYLVSIGGLALFSAGTAGSSNIETVLILRFLGGAFGSSPFTNAAGVIADMFPARVFIRQTDKIFDNVWSAYLRSGDLSVCLRNGSDLSVCLHHLPRSLPVLARTGRQCGTHGRMCSHSTVGKRLYTSDYVLVVLAAQKLLRLRELIQSPWPIIPNRVASNREGSFVC